MSFGKGVVTGIVMAFQFGTSSGGLAEKVSLVLASRARRDMGPFVCTVLFFLCACLSPGVMCWPYMVPYALTVADAAAPDVSLRLLFYGGVVVLPVIALYTCGVYGVLRAKVRADPA